MERTSHKERSSRHKSRDDDREREREHNHHRHHHRDDERRNRDDDREDERLSRKRKEHGGAEDGAAAEKVEKRAKRERRRFEDRAALEDPRDGVNGGRHKDEERREERERSRDRARSEERRHADERKTRDRRFKDDKVKEEGFGVECEAKEPQKNKRSDDAGHQGDGAVDKGGGSGAKAVVLKSLSEASEVAPNAAATHPLPTKVSSITTTNENGGNITRSDEVPGKSSTDGATTSVTGKSGSLSLDALAKAKKALQMKKELAEKMKRIPMLGKVSSSTADNNAQVGIKNETSKFPSSLPTISSGAPIQAVPGSSSLGDASTLSVKSSAAGIMPPLSGHTVEAVKKAQELVARMGFRQDPQFSPLINIFSAPAAEVSAAQKPSKAPVLRLDAQGREIDEHGNVINMPKLTNLSTLKVNINKQKKEAFQIIRPDLDANLESNPHFDAGMGINKTKLLRPKRMSFQFVEEGKWSRQAEITRFKSQFGEAQAKELKTKQAQLAKAKAEPDINPNLIEVSERVVIKEKQKEPIPEIEWWDKPLLASGAYTDDAKDTLNTEKITIYVEHPLPIQPPAEPAPPPPQPLKLTKKENKKLRTQRRLAKERDRQEMIRQGLIEPPKPKVKMSNLMKVLGAEATQDPTKLEMEIRSAAAEREQAHVDRNIARKLTPAERREKKERKLFEDQNTLETIVTVYRVNSLSHPKTRFQVDVNAQENRLTGCAVIAEGISVVVVEGGRKSNKRYKQLMLKRINWAAVLEKEDDEEEDTDVPVNKCSLVWQGSVAKPSFNRFLIHQCRTEAAARKVFADAGVPHYWDLAVNYSDELI